MIPIVCIDDKKGMMFNHRRQSMDEFLRQDILNHIQSNKLWMNQYSAKQFENENISDLVVNENFLDLAKTGDYCFVENHPLHPYLSKIEKIIIYHWNRVYPADIHLDIMIEQSCWKLLSQTEFVGKSHEKITKEVFFYEK